MVEIEEAARGLESLWVKAEGYLPKEKKAEGGKAGGSNSPRSFKRRLSTSGSIKRAATASKSSVVHEMNHVATPSPVIRIRGNASSLVFPVFRSRGAIPAEFKRTAPQEKSSADSLGRVLAATPTDSKETLFTHHGLLGTLTTEKALRPSPTNPTPCPLRNWVVWVCILKITPTRLAK